MNGKISYNPEIQKHAAFFIDRIIDTPLYFWISVVPYRGYLYNLDNGADLQHQINLDDSLIFEASPTDKVLCMNYFKELINNRLDTILIIRKLIFIFYLTMMLTSKT